MTGLNRTFSKISLEEKKERRAMHEELGRRFASAVADITSLKSAGSARGAHSDPHATIQDLSELVKFSEIPREYRTPKFKKNHIQVESLVKHDMHNEAYNGLLSQRSTSVNSMADGMVDVSKPLPLSFEARRVRIMKSHTSKVESSMSGLFSKNTGGVPQGPVPDLYSPPPTARRFEIESSKQAIRSQMIKSDRRLKETVIAPKRVPQLLGKKVPKDFVPSCAVADVGDAKAVAKQRQAEKDAKVAGSAPFK